jgi:hypothetical protein
MARGRKAQVRYWESRQGYYTTFRGKQYLLAQGLERFQDQCSVRSP